MNKYEPAEKPSLWRTLKKGVVSGLVILSFLAYAVHERLNPEVGVSAVSPSPEPTQQVAAAGPSPVPTDPGLVVPSQPSAPAQPTSQPTFPPSVPQTGPSSSQPQPSATRPAPVQPAATATPRPLPSPTAQVKGQYKDGTYTGRSVDAFFGLVQVQATVKNGQIADVQFLQWPSDRRTSVRINNVAIPLLQQEAIRAQKANVNIITGATLTSEAFMQSLQTALSSAQSS